MALGRAKHICRLFSRRVERRRFPVSCAESIISTRSQMEFSWQPVVAHADDERLSQPDAHIF